MKFTKLCGVLVFTLALASCATYRPTIDTKGVESAKYEQDLRECQAYAGDMSPASEAAGGAAVVAGIAAALGAIIGADVGTSAAAGAVLGGVSGLGRGTGAQIATINNCLRGRGYSVLR